MNRRLQHKQLPKMAILAVPQHNGSRVTTVKQLAFKLMLQIRPAAITRPLTDRREVIVGLLHRERSNFKSLFSVVATTSLLLRFAEGSRIPLTWSLAPGGWDGLAYACKVARRTRVGQETKRKVTGMERAAEEEGKATLKGRDGGFLSKGTQAGVRAFIRSDPRNGQRSEPHFGGLRVYRPRDLSANSGQRGGGRFLMGYCVVQKSSVKYGR